MGSAGQKEQWFKGLPTQTRDRQGRLIHVRVYEDRDFEGLREMYDTFEPKGLESGLPPPDDIVRLKWLNYVTSDLFNVLAIHKGQPIGHIALDLSCTPSCPEYMIFIRKGFRNCGIGTTLSVVMKAVAEESGCEKVVVTVRAANTRAIRVFKKVGFVFSGGIERDRDMELHLRPRKTSRPKVCKR
jgi:RimJ/RimL family protein N-acetyltransferase